MKMATTTYDYDYNDSGTEEPSILCNRDSDNHLGAQLATLYYFMFVFSLLGNGLVLVIIHRFEKLTTVTNILLLNLVLSSVILMGSLPFLGAYMQLSTWIFGDVMCRIVGSVYYLGFYSSVLFLALLTFDRHLAVVYSLGAAHVRTRRYAVISCAVVWLVSGLACIRPMILHTTFFNRLDNKTYCDESESDIPGIDSHQLRKSGFYLQIFFLIFPLAVIVYCYVRIIITVMSSKIVTKFKTVRLIFIIVLLFFICWTPFNIVKVIHDRATDCEEGQRLGYALQSTRTFTYFYFCISPIFYTFVGKKFQNYFKQLLAKRFPSLKRHISVSQHSKTNMSTKSTPNML
ncbi:C-C chemokine receptor type 3-like isoform X2 [Stegastes partitus]|uniref:C-C chemokine receptor type 3-like isoform X2 n=2 Tax=Stegastes partitus TaxID=144197 RepID=A0A9Y4KA36_9TELE|nr:PREDICTED: C-C chemokine receptor type 3-like isoform X2 [Stegastes partitus]